MRARLLAAVVGQFRVPGRSQEDDYRGKLHPDQQPDYRGQSTIHHVVWHPANIETEANVGDPPKQRRYHRAGKDIAQAGFLGAQVLAKVLFVVDQGQNMGFMTRVDYNENGPEGIHDI